MPVMRLNDHSALLSRTAVSRPEVFRQVTLVAVSNGEPRRSRDLR